ncbi:lytic transglycosylase domain-containing protein [Rothia sp. 32237D007AR]
MTSERTKPSLALRLGAGLVAHWQIVASAVLMSAGVVGLSATYEDYCGQTDLTYAPPQLWDDIEAAAEVSGFRAGLLAAQLETESGWVTTAQSHAGAHGLAQFTQDTWDIWGKGDINSPEDSIAAQGRYLAYLSEYLAPYVSDEASLQDIVLAGYNAGPGAVEEFGGIPPYFETQNYVIKIDELASTKYAVTCVPDPSFKQATLVR